MDSGNTPTHSPALRHEGKRNYSLEDFRSISVAEMRGRLERIDNRQAFEIAQKLWKSVERQFTNQYGQLMFRDSHTLAYLAGIYGRQLVLQLERLRRLDFGDIIAEGPGRLDEHLDSLHPLVRFLHPPARVKRIDDSADRLLRYLDFYTDPQASVPESFRRSWLFVLGMILSIGSPMIIIAMFRESVQNKLWLIVTVMLMFITGVFLSVLQLAGFGKLRCLSLYLSFTDEFVSEAMPGGQAPGG